MRYPLALGALLLSFSAQADLANGRPNFDWTNPTTWSDGSTITAAQITGYQLVCTGVQAVNVRIASGTGVPPSTYPPAAQPALPAGNYSCTMAVWGKLTPTATEVLGVASNPVNFAVPQPRMNAPAGLSVN